MANGNSSRNRFARILGSAVLAGLVALVALFWAFYSSYKDDEDSKKQLDNQAIQIAKQETQIALIVEQNQLQSQQLTVEAQMFALQNQTPFAENNPNYYSTATALANQAIQIQATSQAIAIKQQNIEATQKAMLLQSSSICDNFDTPALNNGWAWIDPKGDSTYSFTDKPGFLRITVFGRGHDLYQNVNAPRMLQYVKGDFTVITKVIINPQKNYQAAGLLYWQDENNYVRLERTLVKGIDLLYKIQGEYKAVEIPFSSTTVFLKFELSNQTIQASYSDDGNKWNDAGAVQISSSQNGQIGIAVVNEWQDYSISVDFDYFKFSQCQ